MDGTDGTIDPAHVDAVVTAGILQSALMVDSLENAGADPAAVFLAVLQLALEVITDDGLESFAAIVHGELANREAARGAV